MPGRLRDDGWRGRLGPTVAAAPRVVLLLTLSCAPGEPASFDEASATLETCPTGDAPWRIAVGLAGAEERADALVAQARRLADRCAGRWEPLWAGGECLFRAARPTDAGELLAAGLARARALHDPTGVACCANRLGGLAFRGGDLAAAEAHYQEALAAAEEAGREDLAGFVRNNWAGLLLETGDLGGARDLLEAAEAGFAAIDRPEAAYGAAYNRGVILLELGDALAARETLEGLRDHPAAPADPWTFDAAAVALGNLHVALGETEPARRWFEAVAPGEPDLAAMAALGLGRLALRAGDALEAAAALARASAVAREHDRRVSLVAEAYLAEAEWAAGKADAARERLDRAMRESDAAEMAEPAWTARWVLGRVLLGAGRAAEAAVVLGEAVAILDEAGATVDPESEGLHFLRERADPYVDLAVALARSGGEAAAPRVLEVMARAQARSLRRALGRRADAPPGADLAALRRGLGEHEVLLGYLLGEERGLVLAVTSGAVRAVPLDGRRALMGPLERYRAALRRPVTAGVSAASRPGPTADERADGARLRDALLGPVLDLVAGKERLYVVPDRDLALLPFDALPWDGARYLGDVLESAVLPLAGGPPPRAAAPRAPLLLGGAPEPDAEGAFPSLPWAAYEISEIAALWERSATVLAGRDFTSERLRAAGLGRFRTVHLATHAVASTRDPRRAGVVFSSGERLGMDGVAGLDLGDALVVLSACRTGEGEVLPGEGVVGLGWAFLRAGARGIVVSHWTIDDASTARLMVGFHRRLRDGVDPVRALALARREAARERPHPAYWAPFVVVLRPGA